MKKIKNGVCALLISSLFVLLFPTNLYAATPSVDSKNIKEGTGSVEVVYEAGNENEIPRGEEVNALKTGDSFEVNTYLMVLTSALFLILLPLYYKEKKRESDEN